jgi:hypothetical protein
VTGTHRKLRQDCEVLLRQIDGRLASLRSGRPAPGGTGDRPGGGEHDDGAGELDAAVRMADALRRLVADTARSSAADRARVRAAVHYFVSGGRGRIRSWRYSALAPGPAGRRNDRRPGRSLVDDVRVVNEILRDLGGHGDQDLSRPGTVG